ncbi:hypothetical protein NDU88_007420 [Pleurodeles waltl]|uniref:Uncharacterized protein n=1 Tax=Pleurodeles waltl TaxID=8319 RepID=A0AAV7NUT0_PLEWA|nr:hypothetical protein NDU88_007420 [Pleurodeles waltl]
MNARAGLLHGALWVHLPNDAGTDASLYIRGPGARAGTLLGQPSTGTARRKNGVLASLAACASSPPTAPVTPGHMVDVQAVDHPRHAWKSTGSLLV